MHKWIHAQINTCTKHRIKTWLQFSSVYSVLCLFWGVLYDKLWLRFSSARNYGLQHVYWCVTWFKYGVLLHDEFLPHAYTTLYLTCIITMLFCLLYVPLLFFCLTASFASFTKGDCCVNLNCLCTFLCRDLSGNVLTGLPSGIFSSLHSLHYL